MLHKNVENFRPYKKSRFLQGYYSCKNPHKYEGDRSRIVYRSSYELKFMNIIDNDNRVLKWSSEETIIPYISPVDGKTHRYFVDFKCKMKTNEGIKTYLVEIKPQSQIDPPINKKQKINKTYIKEVINFSINQAKWSAAEAYCKKKGWEFIKLNEFDLGIIKAA